MIWISVLLFLVQSLRKYIATEITAKIGNRTVMMVTTAGSTFENVAFASVTNAIGMIDATTIRPTAMPTTLSTIWFAGINTI